MTYFNADGSLAVPKSQLNHDDGSPRSDAQAEADTLARMYPDSDAGWFSGIIKCCDSVRAFIDHRAGRWIH